MSDHDTVVESTCPTPPVADARPPPFDTAITDKPRRRPRPSKRFFKSRRGCYTCKRRRVKCTEGRPRCSGCTRLALTCEYPVPSNQPATPPFSKALVVRSTRADLEFDDLRFFHHFIIAARPWLPYGCDAVWHNIAANALEYEFLVYAMLGMAAQHLTVSTSGDYSLQALRHRVRAIRTLNASLSEPCGPCHAGGDARRAAIMILTFQTSYMEDGMMEFLSLLRGWMVISGAVSPAFEHSSFKDFTRDAYVESMRNRLVTPGVPSASTLDALDDFSASLKTLTPLCRSVSEVLYSAVLERIATQARTSLIEACLEIVPCFAMTNKLSDEEFRAFTDTQNCTAQVLFAHLLMLYWLLEDATLGPGAEPFAFPRAVLLAWVEKISEGLPSSYKQYMVWPLGMARVSRGLHGTPPGTQP
ncbi:hypothetical protein GQ53DRAFT_635684 [Thozetella sp. PMI_491]|nr:hypothetical protein GQ53DRAFT_635684 [Thozetella sp. PMI_491]